MKLYITRHGKTIWNEQGILQGSLDSPLTKEGVQKAIDLSKKISSYNIQAIVTSDLKRAKDTSFYIKSGSDIPIFYFKELREMSFGDWDGMKITEIQEKYQEDFLKFETDAINFDNKSGETYTGLISRVEKALETIKNLNYENVLIVTHGITVKALQIVIEKKDISQIVKLPVIKGCSLIGYEMGQEENEKILNEEQYDFVPA